MTSTAENVLPMPIEGMEVYRPYKAELARIKADNAKMLFDYEDPKGNKDARSYVHQLRRSKTAVDEVRKKEKAYYLEAGRRIDAEAKEIIQEFEEMIELHAQPLREIEDREKLRAERCKVTVASIQSLANLVIDGKPGHPRDCMQLVQNIVIDDTYGEWESEIELVKAEAIKSLEVAIVKQDAIDAERVELERLRAEKAERDAKDEAERLAKERAIEEERIRKEASERATREAEAKAEQERKAQAEREQKLKEDAARAEREKQEAIARAEAEALAAKAREEQAERDRIAALEAADREAKRQAAEAVEREKQRAAEEANRIAREDAIRAANEQHRAQVKSAAHAALIAHGASEESAASIVEAIIAGKIPHITIAF